MQQRILVPLDGSRLAEMILPHATAIARSTSATLTVLRVSTTASRLPNPIVPGRTAVAVLDPAETLTPPVDPYLCRVTGRLQEQGVPVETRLRQGDAAAQIVECATTDHNIALIAMATHGRHGLDRLVLGSVAEQVLQSTPVPLLLLRSDPDTCLPTEPINYRTILVPLDGSAFAAQALDQATVLATATGATLLLVAVVPTCAERELSEVGVVPYWMLEERAADAAPLTWSLDATAQVLRGQGLHVRTVYTHGVPAGEILHVAAREHADLIVIATHARSGLQRLRFGSVALKVLQGTCSPVLMVRGEELA